MAQQIEIENCEIVCQTEGAALIRFNDYPESNDEWIPWSLIEEGSIEEDHECGVLIVPDWKAKELGFEL